jgi:hypothetical protein
MMSRMEATFAVNGQGRNQNLRFISFETEVASACLGSELEIFKLVLTLEVET